MHIYSQFSLVQSLFVIWKVIVVAFSLLLSNLLHAKFVFLFFFNAFMPPNLCPFRARVCEASS